MLIKSHVDKHTRHISLANCIHNFTKCGNKIPQVTSAIEINKGYVFKYDLFANVLNQKEDFNVICWI